MQAPALTPEAVDRALEAVLARPEFAPPPPSPITLLARRALTWAWDRVADLLRRILPDIDPSAPAWRSVLEVLLFAAIVLGVVLAFYLGEMRWRRRRRRRDPLAAGGAAPQAAAEDWEREARALVARGRWRDAAFALYQAVVYRLAQRGVVRLDPSKTPGDYRREARREPSVRGALEAFVRVFEPVAFGRERATAEAYDRLKALAAPLGARG